MSDWYCLLCRTAVRGATRMPTYCSRCGNTLFKRLEADSPSASCGEPPSDHRPSSPVTSVPEPSSDLRVTLLKPIPAAPAPRKERRGAKRVQPHRPLHIEFSLDQPLQVMDISASGLVVEQETAFKFGTTYEADLRRSDQSLRLRLQVVRSFVVRTVGTSGPAIRYRTAFQFVDVVPPAFFTLIPELSEGS